jgi:sugar phosphate isomerase/epimerase
MRKQRSLSRRAFVKIGAAGVALAAGPGPALAAAPAPPAAAAPAPAPRVRPGTVTYNIAKDWDLPTLIKNCALVGLEAVELRTTHTHGVEPALSAAQRADVKKRFADSPVVLWGLGTTCEFQSPDAAEVKKNIELCRDFCVLARDVGARGVKVRPNGLPAEVPVEKTLEQIGKSLGVCGRIAAEHGVELWCEVHGGGTAEPRHMATIMRHCGDPNAGLTWNSNGQDVKNGSVKESFELLKPWIKSIHLKDLYVRDYPYREFFALLKGIGYDRPALAEIDGSADPLRVLRYFVALLNELAR